MSVTKLDKFFTAWNDGQTGYFKVAPIKLSVTGDAKQLELAAKETAKEIEAEVTYAWDLGTPKSEAWWLEWGGYSLEEEIPYFAATSSPEALEKIDAFDPDDNEFECDTLDEFKEILFGAYDEDLTAKDLQRGFQLWLETLSDDVIEALEKDLISWTSRAK
ncbi:MULTISPECIES: hypothetical protein [Sneathiella]|jgi:hypothetical protein|uniref:hypothetical protein n=1 Tax=Sneathiella TaxID=510690 RepID=UPI00146C1E32|nr:hypothetical protein [Sneathiella aquimaris]